MGQSNANFTRGGRFGHWTRRFFHLSQLLIPILYFPLQQKMIEHFGMSLMWLVVTCLTAVLIFEGVRVARGIVVFGQRDYEARRLSALAWGAIGLSLVLLFAPQPGFAVAIIASAAVVDPLIGEMRLRRQYAPFVFSIGVLAVAVIWWLCSYYYGFAWWWLLIMSPLTVSCEWPSLSWIDDNALMQLGPLIAIIIFNL